MKKMNFLSGLAVAAIAVSAISCSHDDNLYTPVDSGEAYKTSFEENVMGGLAIDGSQTWNTAQAVKLSITTEMAGKLKIYTANPVGEEASALATITVGAGTSELTVAKPGDVTQLYAALFDTDGSVRVMEIKDNKATFTAARTISSSRGAKAQRRYNIDFPDQPTTDSYKTDKPAGATYLANGYLQTVGNVYLDEDCSGKDVQISRVYGEEGCAKVYLVHKEGGNGIIAPTKLYLDAYYQDWSNGGAIYPEAQRYHLYICPGVTLKLTEAVSKDFQAGLIMHIAPGATLECEGELVLNSLTIYNAGTIKAAKIHANSANGGPSYSMLYNQGKVEVTGDLSVENANSFIVNEGTITAENYGSHGSGNFWNKEGQVTIAKKTIINSNANVWINEGNYTTEDLEYTAGSINVWNLCKLTVTNNFLIRLGDSSTSTFNMDAGSSVVTEYFEMQGPGRVNMAGNSLFKVNETATMNITKAEYGIWGPTSGDLWAVFQAKDVVAGRTTDLIYQVNYGGNLYVAADSHFANGMNGQYPYIDFYGNAKIVNGQANAPYTIPANGNCSDGYNAGTPGGGDEPTMYYYYAFEDLGGVQNKNNTDIDFNDIVLRVSAPVDGNCDVQLVAAGGELSTKILYNGTVICEDAHQRIGGTMKNTGSVDTNAFATIYELTGITDASDLPFAIEVERTDGTKGSVTVQASGLGEAPLMIKVAGIAEGANAGKWFWVKERTNIKVAYPQFVNWATNRTTATDWYKNYVSDNVVSY